MPDVSAPRQENRSPIDRLNLGRTDWRVLLPTPKNGFEHMLLLGGPAGLSDVIVKSGLAGRVSHEIPGKPSADAVAILHDARLGCEAVAGALLPGGVLYWEIESRHAPAVWIRSRIKSRLRRARLSLTGLHWVRPDFERCELFIPINVRAAMEWYLRSWADTSSPLRHLLVSHFGGAVATAAVVGRSVRHCAVTAIAGPLQDACPSILAHPAVPSDLWQAGACQLVVNRSGRDASRRVIVLPFRPGCPEPVAVLKFSRFAERNTDIQKEQEVVARVRARLDPAMKRSIPAPLGMFAWGRVVVGAETYAGRSLSRLTAASKRRRIEDLRLVARWLQEFHRQSKVSEDPLSSSQVKTWIDDPIRSYGLSFGNSPAEERLFERVHQRARSLLGSPFPLVWSHPAFSEMNICRSRDEIRVIDWEDAEIGPPLRDLIYFVTVWYYRFKRERGEDARIDSFRRLFFPSVPDPLAALASETLEEHMRSLSIDPRFLSVMLVLTSVTHALGRLKRARAFGEAEVDARRGNPHIAYLGILAENRDRLFSGEKSYRGGPGKSP